MKIKTKSNILIAVSSVAFIAFIIYALLGNVVIDQNSWFYTYAFRMGLINDVFLFIPFVALFVFSILQQKLNYVDGRFYIVGIFLLYLIQGLLFLFLGETMDYSVLCCSIIGKLSSIRTAVIVTRCVAFLLLAVDLKFTVKLYSVTMVMLLVSSFVAVMTSDSSYLNAPIKNVILPIAVDILFNVALFIFGDVCDRINKTDSPTMAFFEKLFDNAFECDEDEDFEIPQSRKVVIIENDEEDTMDNIFDYITEESVKNGSVIEIEGEKFLIDSPENAVLHLEIKRFANDVTVSGFFEHTFTEDQAVWILKKKSVINETFRAIDLEATADTHIGVEFVEEGRFTVTLVPRTFDREEYGQICRYLLRFKDAITIIQNTESYGY